MSGQILQSGHTLQSPSGLFGLVLQGDGNLVEYNNSNTVVWASGTSAPGSTLQMQGDGNLVFYNPSSIPSGTPARQATAAPT